MATYRTSSAGGATSGTGNRTITVTPAVGDLLVVFVKWSGNSNTSPTCTDNNGSGTYDRILTALNNGSADIMAVFVRTALMVNTTSTVITPVVGGGNNTAGEIVVVHIAGMVKVGSAAVLQSGKQENQTSGVPTPVLGASAKTFNLTIIAIGSTTTAGAVPNASWTERQDANQTSPVTALEVATRNSGFTGTSAAAVSVASAVWSSCIVEFDTRLTYSVSDDMGTLFDNDDSAIVLEKNRAGFGDDVDVDGLVDVTSMLESNRASFSEDQGSNLLDLLVSFLFAPVSYDAVIALLKDRGQITESFTPDDSGVNVRLVLKITPFSDSYSGLADALAALMRDLAQAYDGAGLGMSESIAALFRYRAGIGEDVDVDGLNEALTALFRYRASFSDSNVPTDAASLALALLQSFTESAFPMSDTTIALLRDLAILNDDFSAGLADLVLKSLLDVAGATPINAAFGDDVDVDGLTDAVTALERMLWIGSEVLTYSDLLGALERHLANTSDDAGAGMSDTVAALYRFLASMSESFAPSDNPIALMRFLAIMSDALGLTDLTSAIGVARASMSDDTSTGQTDLVSALMRCLASLQESVSVLDDASAIERFIGSFSDSLTFSETVGIVAPILAGVSDILGMNDLVVTLITLRALFADDDGPNYNDILTALLRQRISITEQVPCDDAVLAIGRFVAMPSDALILADLIGALHVYNGQFFENEGANLTELVYALEVYLASLSDTVPLSDTAVMTAPLFGSMSDVFISSDAVSALETLLAAFSDQFASIDVFSAIQTMRGPIADDSSISLVDLVAALQRSFAQMAEQVPVSDAASALMRMLASFGDLDNMADFNSALHVFRGQLGEDNNPSMTDFLVALEVYRAQIADSWAMTDSANALGPAPFSFSDTFNSSDSVLALERMLASFAETWVLSDLAAALQVYRSSISENSGANLADLLAAMMPHLAQISDAVPTTDLASALMRILMFPFDSLSLSDAASGLQRSLAQMSDDSGIVLADNILARLVLRAVIGDDCSLTLAELVEFSFGTFQLKFSIFDDVSLGLVDSVAALLRLKHTLSEQVDLSDLATAALALRRSFSDNFAPTDAVNTIAPVTAAFSDSFGPLDLLSARETYRAGLTEDSGSSLSDLVNALMRHRAVPTDSMALVDAILALQRDLGFPSDSFISTDAVGALQAMLASTADSLGVSDAVLARFVYRAVIGEDEGSLLADLLAAALIISGSSAIYVSFSEDQGLNYQDIVSFLTRILARIDEGITYADLASDALGLLARASETLTMDDSMQALASMLHTMDDEASLTDSLYALEAILADPADLADMFDVVQALLDRYHPPIHILDALIKFLGMRRTVRYIPGIERTVSFPTMPRTVAQLGKIERTVKLLSKRNAIREISE